LSKGASETRSPEREATDRTAPKRRRRDAAQNLADRTKAEGGGSLENGKPQHATKHFEVGQIIMESTRNTKVSKLKRGKREKEKE
jgi:hypothetical protein